MTDKGILIEPIVNGEIYGYPIQAKEFSFGLKITNCSDSPSEEFSISRIRLSSASGQNIADNFGDKKFFVGVINPGDSNIINVGSNGQFMHGLVDIKFTILPKKSDIQIMSLQKNPFTGEFTKVGFNHWMDFLYIKSSSEYRQEISTKWIIKLTWATAILTLIQVASIVFRN